MSKFINPYAFVSFKKVNNQKSLDELENEKKFSGSIEYTIKLKTPLIIPNTTTDSFNKSYKVSKSYGIYSYENLKNKNKQDSLYQPVIPGSEIRGCIRNVFEAMTNSCYNLNQNADLYFSQRINPRNAYKPGLLINIAPGKWELHEAMEISIIDGIINENYSLTTGKQTYNMFDKVYVNCQNTITRPSLSRLASATFDKVYVRGQNISCEPKFEFEEGYVFIGNKGIKNFQSKLIFIKQEDSNNLLTISKGDRNYQNLKVSIESFVDKTGKYAYQRYLDAMEINKTITIFYNLVSDTNEFRFSPAQIGRVVYNKTLKDKVGDTSYCIDKLCPACLLFGNISANNAVSSRIRFTDAFTKNYSYSEENYIDLISGTPKYSNVYFYSSGNGIDWDNNLQIAGRKFYWHHIPNLDKINKKVQNNSNFNIKSRYYYVKSGSTFNGKVYFDNVTLEELKLLYKAISLVDDNHMHKLGHGKPFGFGSCNFKINNLNCDDISLDTIKNDVHWEDTIEDKELKYVLDFHALDKYVNVGTYVDYPFMEGSNNDNGYEWFAENKKPLNQKKLPKLVDNNPCLEAFIKNERKRHNF